jgi:hypothetical protein
MKVQMRSIGAEQLVVVMKLLKESGAKELCYPVLKMSQPDVGGTNGQNKAV